MHAADWLPATKHAATTNPDGQRRLEAGCPTHRIVGHFVTEFDVQSHLNSASNRSLSKHKALARRNSVRHTIAASQSRLSPDKERRAYLRDRTPDAD